MKKSYSYIIKIIGVISLIYGAAYIVTASRALYYLIYFLPSNNIKPEIPIGVLQGYYAMILFTFLLLLSGFIFIVAGIKLFKIKKIGVYYFLTATVLILISTLLLESGIGKNWSGIILLAVFSTCLLLMSKKFNTIDMSIS